MFQDISYTLIIRAKYSSGASYFPIACCRSVALPSEALLRARGSQSRHLPWPVVPCGLHTLILGHDNMSLEHHPVHAASKRWCQQPCCQDGGAELLMEGQSCLLPHGSGVSAMGTELWKQRNQPDFSSSPQTPIPSGKSETSGTCKTKRGCKITDATSDPAVLKLRWF